MLTVSILVQKLSQRVSGWAVARDLMCKAALTYCVTGYGDHRATPPQLSAIRDPVAPVLRGKLAIHPDNLRGSAVLFDVSYPGSADVGDLK